MTLSNTIDLLRKRQAYRVPITNDEFVLIRGLTYAELEDVQKFGSSESADPVAGYGIAIGYGLLQRDGNTQEFARLADETAEVFGRRVLAEIGTTLDVLKDLAEKIVKLTINGPSVEKLTKN